MLSYRESLGFKLEYTFFINLFVKGGNLLNNKYYKILRFDGKGNYEENKSKKNIKEYFNKYIDEDINEILFIVPIEGQKKSPTTIPQ